MGEELDWVITSDNHLVLPTSKQYDYSTLELEKITNYLSLLETTALNSYSTNHNVRKITLEYTTGETISLYCTNDSEHPLNFNWIVDVGGLKFGITSLNLFEVFNLGMYQSKSDELRKEMLQLIDASE
ncbi:hypothetical protein CGL56_05530 [Neolewinella marina]|uniref:Uncharacterized protein n=2 Tax=Neolewinella marina TaxID=438751 RepID=A0A2G0CKN2_9BACT|nr:hypothetical protein CGL56_05530 [Neolewinella marina]